MKIRMDFVTNSSSSSFVIMYKSIPDMDKEVIEKYPFIKNYINMFEKALIGDREKITTIEELDKYIINEYGWRDLNTVEKILEDDSWVKGCYEKYKKRIENGYAITFKSVDYNDESTGDILWSLNDGENFIVECES